MDTAPKKALHTLITGYGISISLCIFLCCSSPGDPDVLYEPQIVFVGSVTGDHDSLPGNSTWPNRCWLDNDTVRMTFFSEGFKEQNAIRSGDFIRIDLFPCSTCISDITNRHARFHMARYLAANISYEITPADTILATEYITMQIQSLSRTRGGSIELGAITAVAKPLTGNLGLDLKDGRIFGTIE
ncbi:MAG: hypothetical protein JW768_04580 [Chitinispirillaceae bacterium]|nr:hypothetical protein [Chitinispirillaceae bacterium]